MHTNKASRAGDKRSQLKLQPILIARLNSTKNIIQLKTWRKATYLPITFVNRKEIENGSEKSQKLCFKALSKKALVIKLRVRVKKFIKGGYYVPSR